jgi:hypothetical protein
MDAWTHDGLRAHAEQMVPAIGDRFAAIATGDDLEWHLPHDGEDYDAFTDRSLDTCAEQDGDGIIIAWQWPGLAYVTVMLACPKDGTTTIAVRPNPRTMH